MQITSYSKVGTNNKIQSKLDQNKFYYVTWNVHKEKLQERTLIWHTILFTPSNSRHQLFARDFLKQINNWFTSSPTFRTDTRTKISSRSYSQEKIVCLGTSNPNYKERVEWEDTKQSVLFKFSLYKLSWGNCVSQLASQLAISLSHWR